MNRYELKDCDSEDLEDLFVKIETSFDIIFIENELADIITFGQLCDHIINKIQLNENGSCTKQQAFYKLRETISSSSFDINANKITTNLLLIDIFPRKFRQLRVSKIEENLGFKLNILSPPNWIVYTLLFLIIASFFALFYNPRYGILGITLFVFIFRFASKNGIELNLKTVGQLAEKMTRDNYLKSRRNSKTFNKNEIEKVLIDLFIDKFDLDKSQLTRDAKFR